MKKTFVTTALALSTAGAASADLLLCGLEFGTSQGAAGYTLTGAEISSVTVSKQSATLTETAIHTAGNSNSVVKVSGLAGVTLKDQFSFIVTGTFHSSTSGWPVIFAFGTDQKCFKVDITGSSNYKIDTDGLSNTGKDEDNFAVSTTTAVTEGVHTVALTMINVNDGSGDALVTLTVDGVLAGSGTLSSSLRTDTVLDSIALGGRIGNNNNPYTGDFNSVQLYRIPEPATATLSLLALAGLAARRRRK